MHRPLVAMSQPSSSGSPCLHGWVAQHRLSLPIQLGCPTQALLAYMVGLPNTGSPCQYSWAAQHRLSLPIQLGCPTQALSAIMVAGEQSGGRKLHTFPWGTQGSQFPLLARLKCSRCVQHLVTDQLLPLALLSAWPGWCTHYPHHRHHAVLLQ